MYDAYSLTFTEIAADAFHSFLEVIPLHMCRNAAKTPLTDYDQKVAKSAYFIEHINAAESIVVIESDYPTTAKQDKETPIRQRGSGIKIPIKMVLKNCSSL